MDAEDAGTVNPFLTITWRGRPQFGTLVRWVFSSRASEVALLGAQHTGSKSRSSQRRRHDRQSLEREIGNGVYCRTGGERQRRAASSRRTRTARPCSGIGGHAAATRMGRFLRAATERVP